MFSIGPLSGWKGRVRVRGPVNVGLASIFGRLKGADFLLQPHDDLGAGEDNSSWEGASVRVLRSSPLDPASAICRISGQTEVLSKSP
jgi:hypothetical protein